MKKALSFVVLFFILFGLTPSSFAEDTTPTTTTTTGTPATPAPVPTGVETSPVSPGTNPITVTPTQPNPAGNPINVQPGGASVKEPVPADAKGKALYYLRHLWAAIVLLILILIFLWAYRKENWGSKR
ncbi:MAG TPA: hypothetical protein VJ824_16340 [Bacillota bacterium]|nr:hypothetical protein [Bacillota bacterium]